MIFEQKHDAFMKGFSDGYLGHEPAIVESLHLHYERGYITGASERNKLMKAPLNFNTLSTLNKMRSEDPKGFNHLLNTWTVMEWGNAVGGEVGEAQNIAKKMRRLQQKIRGNKSADMDIVELRKRLGKEIADAIIYLDLWATSQGIDAGEAVREVFNAKSIEIGVPHYKI
jgi:hypothetical protein